MKNNTLATIALATLLLGNLALQPALAKTQALIIGINEYDHQTPLRGAVNDANLIKSALLDNGVSGSDIKLLLNHEATKQAIHTEWLNMIANAQKGDTLIFTYAGHGGQEQDNNNDEASGDDKDENFLLSSFGNAPHADGAANRIVDDELYQWLYETEAKGIQVIVIADSCHSGTMTRSLSLVSTETNEYDLSDKPLPPPAPVGGERLVAPKELSNVIFLASSSDSATTPEVEIDSVMHGVLSWSFAKAIQGAADNNHDGKLTKGEMIQYIREMTLNTTKSTQSIHAEPRGNDDLVLIPLQQTANTTVSPNETVSLRIINGEPDTPLQNTSSTNNNSELLWDIAKGVVQNVSQDTIARGITNSADMQPIIDKHLLLKQVTAYIQQGKIAESSLLPNNTMHKVGDKLRFSVNKIRYPYLTQFNLTGNGTVQFLYPTSARDTPAISLPNWSLDLEVTPSLGGEGQLISIFSEKPLPDLQKMLTTLDQTKHSAELLAVLPSTLQDINFQISQIDHFTEE
jgi:uncharacterized caspase-like protein